MRVRGGAAQRWPTLRVNSTATGARSHYFCVCGASGCGTWTGGLSHGRPRQRESPKARPRKEEFALCPASAPGDISFPSRPSAGFTRQRRAARPWASAAAGSPGSPAAGGARAPGAPRPPEPHEPLTRNCLSVQSLCC